ncbi:hypothetical protein GW17_00039498, partial [Ensete ventricosum]
VNEYSALKTSTLYSWGELSPGNFFLRLGSLSLVTFTILGAPIAAASFNPSKVLARDRLLGSYKNLVQYRHIDQLLVQYISNCRSIPTHGIVRYRTVPSVPVLYRTDTYRAVRCGIANLHGISMILTDKVKPVIKLLKQTLVGTGALLVSAVSLFIFAAPVEDFLHSAFKSNDNNLNSATSQIKPNLRLALAKVLKEELLRLPTEVKDDDDLAAAAAEAADGRPVYCRDRFYRALAGGQYCKWDDLLN